MASAAFLSDLTKVRGRTRKHSTEGAATAGGAPRRATVLRLLNDILAGELIWLMRYRRRHLLAGARPEESSAADGLARRIVELGGEPDLDPDHLRSRRRADYACRGSLGDMIREDLRAESIVIESYTEVIGFLGDADPSTREMLEANLSREGARAAQLARILRDLEGLEEAG